ncbi:MAG: 3-deoxy-manno-octulosonate cytidylyltransferase [Saprospiraceae bacterium]|nr:3-deoxy-manno-octulosonate cytidylyltransferase [Saprospiraceae bacterium]
MQFLGIIPARFQSSRFPGKPLVNIAGIPMIDRVYKQARKSKLLDRVVVATDSEIIFDHCKNAKIDVLMTSDKHQSGTDRIAEVARTSKTEVVVNIQGDEPFIPPMYIDQLCQLFLQHKIEIATLIAPIKDEEVLSNPNIVKAVTRTDGRALYFSRSVIPFHRNLQYEMVLYRHLGIYAFGRKTLLDLADLPQGNLERYELLEQLRWLEAGYDIMTSIVSEAPIGVDVPDDVGKIEHWMHSNSLR